MKTAFILVGLLLGATISEARPRLVKKTYIKQVRVNKNPNSINLLVGKSKTDIDKSDTIYGERITEVGYENDVGIQYMRRVGKLNLGGAILRNDSAYLSIGLNF
jgi:hypothetical protein